MINTNYDYSQAYPSAYVNYYNQGSQAELVKTPVDSFGKKMLKSFGNMLPCLPKEVKMLERGLAAVFILLASLTAVVILLALIPVYKNFMLKNDQFPVEFADALKQNDSQIFRIVSTAALNRSVEDNETLAAFLTNLKEQLNNKTLTKLSGQLDQVTEVKVEPESNGTVAISFSALTKPMTVSENDELQKLVSFMARNASLFNDIVFSNTKLSVASALVAADTAPELINTRPEIINVRESTSNVPISEAKSSEVLIEATTTAIPESTTSEILIEPAAEKVDMQANRPNVEFKQVDDEIIEGKPIVNHHHNNKPASEPVVHIQKPYIQYGPVEKADTVTLAPQVFTDKNHLVINLTPVKPSIEDKEIEITPQEDFTLVPNKEEVQQDIDNSYRPIAKQDLNPTYNRDYYDQRPSYDRPVYMNKRRPPPPPYYQNRQPFYRPPQYGYVSQNRPYGIQGRILEQLMRLNKENKQLRNIARGLFKPYAGRYPTIINNNIS